MKRCRLEMTKKGYPAMWECGGKSTNTGRSDLDVKRNKNRRRNKWKIS